MYCIEICDAIHHYQRCGVVKLLYPFGLYGLENEIKACKHLNSQCLVIYRSLDVENDRRELRDLS